MDGGDSGIVDQVVDGRGPRAALDLRVPLDVAGPEVPEEQDLGTVIHDQAALGVGDLAVGGTVESLGDQVAAVGDTAGGVTSPFLRSRALERFARDTEVLVDAPRERAMVDDDVVRVLEGGEAVGLPAARLRVTGLAGAHANVADDNIVGADEQASADERDAGRGGGLAGDRATMRGPRVARASESDPGPSAARVVTRRIRPPRPPGVLAAQPSAPGKAGRGAAADAEESSRQKKMIAVRMDQSISVSASRRR
ncbi:MAG: hypothetical protein RLZZ93_1374 [Actinomycetota bacterium]